MNEGKNMSENIKIYATSTLQDAYTAGHLMDYIMGNQRIFRKTELRAIIKSYEDRQLEKITEDQFLENLRKVERVAKGRPVRKLSAREIAKREREAKA